MAEITANLVKELREKTDAPMMECKKALAEAGGDLDKAEAILRIKLGNKASKAASRVAAEGVVAACIAPDGKCGALVEINCETDFVAKNAEFLAFAAALAELVVTRQPSDVDALSRLRWEYRGRNSQGSHRQDRRECRHQTFCSPGRPRQACKLYSWRGKDRCAG
jgi:elongation factor Ts